MHLGPKTCPLCPSGIHNCELNFSSVLCEFLFEAAQPVLSTVDSQRVAEQNHLLVRIFAQEMAVDVTSV